MMEAWMCSARSLKKWLSSSRSELHVIRLRARLLRMFRPPPRRSELKGGAWTKERGRLEASSNRAARCF